MNFRIKQIGKSFFPQRKVLGFWVNLKVPLCSTRYSSLEVKTDSATLDFSSLEAATKAIINYQNNYLHNFRCRGHLIKCYYDEATDKFLYVDTNSLRERYPKYSDVSEQLCERIAYDEDIRISNEKAAKKVTIHKFKEDE